MASDFNGYWQRVRKATPALAETEDAGGKLTLTIDSFKTCIRRAYEEGVRDGQPNRKSRDMLGDELFSKIFGDGL